MNEKTTEEIMEEISRDVEERKLYLTIGDIYRRARELYNLRDFDFGDNTMKAPNKLCIEHAVNVARWMPSIPHLDYTRYGTVYLWWQFNNVYLSMEFFPNLVRVVKANPNMLEQSFEYSQHHAGNIQVDMLFNAVVQANVEAGFQVDTVPKPWDEFTGISVVDLDMDEIERREREAGERFAEAFEKTMKQRQEQGDYTEFNKEELTDIIRESNKRNLKTE